MGFPAHLLIFFLALCLLGGGEAGAAANSCLKCHTAHYREVAGCVGCHGGDPRSVRKSIAHHDLIAGRFAWFAVPGAAQVERGRKLVERSACRRCHVTAGKGNALASDLDRLPRGTTPQQIFKAISNPAALMPAFHFDERDITGLVIAILAGERQRTEAGRGATEAPQVVHFSNDRRERENVFEKQCGPCHMLLTRNFAGQGRGDAGPNLSGLLSPHYPASYKGRESWSAERLKGWLANPRKVRETARMRPVALEAGEFGELLKFFAAPSSP